MYHANIWFLSTFTFKILYLSIFSATVETLSVYDRTILADSPVGYWPLDPSVPYDFSGHNITGVFTNNPSTTRMPNNDTVSVFDGVSQYFTVKDNNYLEVVRTGILTIEAWFRPDTLQFDHGEGSGYVQWMGKGNRKMQCWAARIYSYTNAEGRPNRISGYAFNLTGGFGVGSFFQDPISIGEWILYTLIINTVNTSNNYPTGFMKIFKNGIKRDQDSLASLGIILQNSTAPMRVATRDLQSFFKGAIGKVALFDYELSPAKIQNHFKCMTTNTFCK